MMKDRLANTSYKWSSPRAWLIDRINTLDKYELLSVIFELLAFVDSDDIQFLYQDKMDADGYFDPINKEADR